MKEDMSIQLKKAKKNSATHIYNVGGSLKYVILV